MGDFGVFMDDDDSIMTITSDGTKIWRNLAGRIHRNGAPALETTSGTRKWYQDGRMHRLDGPAFEGADGKTCWWRDGKEWPEGESAHLGEKLARAFETAEGTQKPVAPAPRAVFKSKGLKA